MELEDFRDDREILFENKYKMTDKILADVMKYAIKRWYKIFCYTFSLIIFLLFLIVLSNSFDGDTTMIYMSIFLLCASIFLFVLCKFYAPIRIAKHSAKVERIQHNGELLERDICFFDDCIRLNKTSIYKYSQITKVIRTTKYVLFFIENTVIIIVVNDAFVIGNLKDFSRFIVKY